LKVGKVPFQTF